MDPEKLLEEFKSMRLESAGKESSLSVANVDDIKRIVTTDFVGNEARYENSLKFLPIWLEAFILTAIAHSFGPVMKPNARKRLWDGLKVKYDQCKSDFATY